jgi:hypothetical protein
MKNRLYTDLLPAAASLIGLAIGLTLSGCGLAHDNPLDPENPSTQGIGFTGVYDATAPWRLRFTESNHLFTVPFTPMAGGLLEEYIFRDDELELRSSYQSGAIVRDIADSPDGSELALVEYFSLVILDRETMTYKDEIPNPSVLSFTDACYSSSGDLVFATSGAYSEVVYALSRQSHAPVDSLTDFSGMILKLECHGDHLYVFSIQSSLVLTSFLVGEEIVKEESWDLVYEAYPRVEDVVAFDPAGGRVFFCSYGKLYHGDLKSPFEPEVESTDGTVFDLALDPLREYLFAASNTGIAVYTVSPFRKIVSLSPGESLDRPFSTYGIEVAPDGKSAFVNALQPEPMIARLKVRF